MGIPPILPFLELPKVTSSTLESLFPLEPVISFGEQLPHYAEPPELRIYTAMCSGKVVFQSASQAVFIYHTGMLWYYEREVTAVLVDLVIGEEGAWLVHILDKLDFLEFLEL